MLKYILGYLDNKNIKSYTPEEGVFILMGLKCTPNLRLGVQHHRTSSQYHVINKIANDTALRKT